MSSLFHCLYYGSRFAFRRLSDVSEAVPIPPTSLSAKSKPSLASRKIIRSQLSVSLLNNDKTLETNQSRFFARGLTSVGPETQRKPSRHPTPLRYSDSFDRLSCAVSSLCPATRSLRALTTLASTGVSTFRVWLQIRSDE